MSRGEANVRVERRDLDSGVMGGGVPQEVERAIGRRVVDHAQLQTAHLLAQHGHHAAPQPVHAVIGDQRNSDACVGHRARHHAAAARDVSSASDRASTLGTVANAAPTNGQ